MDSFILNPIGAEEFLHVYWRQHRWLHIQRALPQYFERTVSFEEIDRLVCSTRIPPANLSMAQDNDPLPLSSYCYGEFVDQQKMLSRHRQGATIILRSIEQWSPAVAAIRSEVESLLGFEVQINIYLTPKQEKSTPPHWDTHDLFVLQLAGAKCWRLFEGARTLPLENERFQTNEDHVGGMTDEILLEAGDTLFLPRGVIHEPVATDYSIHLSVGVRTLRWLDVCMNALRLAAMRNGDLLRENVGIENGAEVDSIHQCFEGIISDPAVVARALEQTRESQKLRHWTDHSGLLHQHFRGTPPNQQSAFRRRRGLVTTLEENGNGISLLVGNESLALPKRMTDGVALALSGRAFKVSELPKLEEQEKVALCIALCEIGVLRESSGPHERISAI